MNNEETKVTVELTDAIEKLTWEINKLREEVAKLSPAIGDRTQ